MSSPKIKVWGIILILSIAGAIYFSPQSTPDYPILYSFKRGQEKFFTKLKFTPDQKYNYLQFLLETRLNELKYLSKYQEFNYIRQSSLRYSTTAGLLTQQILTNNQDEMVSDALSIFKTHQQIIQEIIDNYPKEFNHEWKYLIDDLNYLDVYAQQLQQSQP